MREEITTFGKPMCVRVKEWVGEGGRGWERVREGERG